MKEQERDAAPRSGEGRIKAQERQDKRHPGPGLLDRMRALFGIGGASIRDDIEDALEETGTAEVFSPQERAMLRNVLGLHEVRVEDIMVPRTDIIAVTTAMTLRDVLAVFRSAGHSRLPVHGETLDDPRGMIHIRDFMNVVAGSITGQKHEGADLSIAVADGNVTRPVLFAPPSMRAIDLLVKMQASRTHMALVIDEYGGTDGLVSIEDIVEVIVGDIEDEHDEAELPLIEPMPEGAFLAEGRASLEDVSAALGVNLAGSDGAEEIDTIGGLVTAMAGRVPNRGEIVTDREDFEFEILDADPRRVKTVKIRPRRVAPGPGESGAAGAGAETASSSSGLDAGISPG